MRPETERPPRSSGALLTSRRLLARVRPTLDERGFWTPFSGHTCSPGTCGCGELRTLLWRLVHAQG